MKTSVRRGLAALAAAAAGIASGLIVASPARAENDLVTVTRESTCDHVAGTWTSTISITNESATASAVVDQLATAPAPVVGEGITLNDTIAPGATVTGSWTVPLSSIWIEVSIHLTWPDLSPESGNTYGETTQFGKPVECHLYSVAQGCDAITFTFPRQLGSILAAPSVGITGPATLTPSTGDPVTVDLPISEASDVPAKVVSFPGSPGLTVTVDVARRDRDPYTQTFTWTAPTCPPAAALPTTGSDLRLPIVLGAGLIAVGAALLVGVRRMRRRAARD